ncbi:hypothetical protein ACHWQZ_G011744 [Mnemiopsis leidyi]
MDRFLATLNRLQDVFTTAGVSTKEIDLPQIVVVGSQSTGKSSVLENIAKQNFLPRGMGIVTRRPLVLQMIKAPCKKVIRGSNHDSWAEKVQNPTKLSVPDQSFETWAQFLHRGDMIYTNMDSIQKEIIDDTNKKCGSNKGISDDPIHLKLYSTKIPSLTLVDLPGLTKIPVGDQPRDIDQRIEKLVRSYIVKENSIILAVSAGNVDIANSDSLKLAREVDPTGSRTIAVITKCDLMENNEESTAVLNGSSVDVKLGLIGVINRNNKQLTEKTPIEKIIALEEDFFLANYPGFADRMGTEYLTTQLCDILISHLKKCLPILADKISVQQAYHRDILKDLGEEPTDPNQTMILLLSKFTDSIAKSIDGKFVYNVTRPGKKLKPVKKSMSTQLQASIKSEDEVKLVTEQTSAGAELFNVFQRDCTSALSAIPADKNLKNLKEVIRGTSGVQPALFIPDGVFNTLILKQLDLFDLPSEHAISKSHQCIAEAIDMIAAKVMMRFPKLEREVVNISKDFLMKQSRDAKEFLAEYLEVEKAYINTNHPEFIERYQVAAALFAEHDEEKEKLKLKQNPNSIALSNTYHQPTTKESALEKLMTRYMRGEDASSEERANKEAELMEKLLIHYFCIVRAHLVDTIPKVVMKFFVRKLSTHLSSLLIQSLYTKEMIADLVQESDKITRKRKASSKMLNVLLEAEKLVSDIAVGRSLH